jgi:cytochrome bd ubiquinol oxidase subunit I
MNYPFWDVPHIGSGWVIGIIAIFHIMISHFAVGGGLYLVITEAKARRAGRLDWLKILRVHSKFFLILTGVFGAVSGVGIWFAIGLAQPEATSALIHNFVFGWAIEWVFFMVELTCAAVYYYTWDRVPAETHLKVGWVYAVASLLTLVIINGILTFMLTPGDAWLAVAGTGEEASKFWNAFFNPLYWPSLLIRTCVCVSLAGVWALVTCSRLDGEKDAALKSSFVRWSCLWVVPAFIGLPVFFAWFLWQVPPAQRELLELGVSTIGPGVFTPLTRTVLIIPLASLSVVGFIYLFAWREPRRLEFSHAACVVLLALFATASGEYARELLRKPYVIGQYMYSNGVRKSRVAAYTDKGYLTDSMWTRPVPAGSDSSLANMAMGEAMYRGQCGACHTRDVYRSMKQLLSERDRNAIGSMLNILHTYPNTNSPYARFMPPLVGKPEEVQALGDYLNFVAHGTNATPQAVASAKSSL